MSARIKAKCTPQFDAWLKSLRDGMTRIRLVRRLERAQRTSVHGGEQLPAEVRQAFFGHL